jgi:hypothetical protein
MVVMTRISRSVTQLLDSSLMNDSGSSVVDSADDDNCCENNEVTTNDDNSHGPNNITNDQHLTKKTDC